LLSAGVPAQSSGFQVTHVKVAEQFKIDALFGRMYTFDAEQ